MLIFLLSQSAFQKCIRITSNKKIAQIYNSDYTASLRKFTIQTPHALSLLKGFVSNFDSIDKDLVNIISKPYLLTTRLSCSDIPFSYGIKSFGVY